MIKQDIWIFFVLPSLITLGQVDGIGVLTVHERHVSSNDVKQRYVTQPSYKAAVYEHAVILPLNPHVRGSRVEALKLMKRNLDIYEEQAISAAQQGASIIVFPEDGVYGTGFSRDAIEPFLEYIPDPSVIQWNPCKDPSRYPNTEVQNRISCRAVQTNIYVVANMGDKQPCNHSDPHCPDDGRFQFNTDVVYDPNGMLIARYHKENLFKEVQFNTPPTVEEIFFDTPFGRFGIFTCFDILFKSPAVDLIEKYDIDSVIFPTAWIDALPLLTAIQYHSAYAVMMEVNLLAANLHRPKYGFLGSGIYTPSGPKIFYRNETTQRGRLLIATVSSSYKKTTNLAASRIDSEERTHILGSRTEMQADESNDKSVTFQSILFYDLYNFIWLEETTGEVSVCQNAICCHLNYSMSDSRMPNSTSGHYALGAFDGLHTHDGQFYLQVCTLLRCGSANEDSCGEPVKFSNTYFDFISLWGEFQTKYIAPEALVMGTEENLALPDGGWQYKDGNITCPAGFSYPLLSVTLLGRAYSRDLLDRSNLANSTLR